MPRASLIRASGRCLKRPRSDRSARTGQIAGDAGFPGAGSSFSQGIFGSSQSGSSISGSLKSGSSSPCQKSLMARSTRRPSLSSVIGSPERAWSTA